MMILNPILLSLILLHSTSSCLLADLSIQQPAQPPVASPVTPPTAEDIAKELFDLISRRFNSAHSSHIIINNTPHTAYFSFCSDERSRCTNDSHSVAGLGEYKHLPSYSATSFHGFKLWYYPTQKSWSQESIKCTLNYQHSQSEPIPHGVVLFSGISSIITIDGNHEQCQATIKKQF